MYMYIYIYTTHFLVIISHPKALASSAFTKLSNYFIPCFVSARFSLNTIMAIRRMLRWSLSSEKRSNEVPKGHLAVYVGESEKKRFVIPLSYLSHPSFQELLCRAEEEFGFHHPMGGLTIPCSEELFVDLTTYLTRT
ncbi:hypothetical protein ACP275_02G013800 [Erythranthe tilingii]